MVWFLGSYEENNKLGLIYMSTISDNSHLFKKRFRHNIHRLWLWCSNTRIIKDSKFRYSQNLLAQEKIQTSPTKMKLIHQEQFIDPPGTNCIIIFNESLSLTVPKYLCKNKDNKKNACGTDIKHMRNSWMDSPTHNNVRMWKILKKLYFFLASHQNFCSTLARQMNRNS